jgi:N-acetylmuramoyl-L-alanine amidase
MKIAIDPGHGMNNTGNGKFDPGAVAAGFREADIALDYGLQLQKAFQANKIPVFMTRADNKEPAPVVQRAGRAEKAGCTHYIALHLNSPDGDPTTHGLQVCFRDATKDKPLAEKLQTALVKVTKFRDLGTDRRPNLAVLKFSKGPAALIELGFITNTADRTDLLSHAVRDAVCKAIVDRLVQKPVAAPLSVPALLAERAARGGKKAARGGGKVFVNINATEFGGGEERGMPSAYGGEVHDNEPEAALPARLPMAKEQRQILVSNHKNGNSVVCLVNDVGPHNTTDDYWNKGTRPKAEEQFRSKTKAENGHIPTNDAGIDLTPAAMDALGVPGKINTRQVHVDWRFVQVPATGLPAMTRPRETALAGRGQLENDPDLVDVFAGRRILKQPGRQPGVGAVQDALIELGETIDLGPGGANRGIFGPRTEAAVESFQVSAGIDVDGQVGKDTIEALDHALAEKRKPRRGRMGPSETRGRRRSRKDALKNRAR